MPEYVAFRERVMLGDVALSQMEMQSMSVGVGLPSPAWFSSSDARRRSTRSIAEGRSGGPADQGRVVGFAGRALNPN
jgi:hypothetical protein